MGTIMSPKIKGVSKARSICLMGKLFSFFFITEFFFTSSKDPVGFYTSGRIIINFTNRNERKSAFASSRIYLISNITFDHSLLVIYKANLSFTLHTVR